ncbi:Chromosome III, complete sequence, related [Eimeria necatrix]|uniref:Chromosome III, complete sequence, related n=1 Tax=Eimeria necatrix TaxID=51315 RepID=U6MKV8_9EIME|nr:Chromosome III, complete sequence, related [Eimeria necatrix]CDJ64887.1 Chromosome III, complete sequence, related [Eimeria necatrix]
MGEEGGWGPGGATSRFQEVLLSGGSKVLQQATEFLGEGPKPLRFLCFIGGLMTVVTSGLACINIFSILVEPSNYILQVYLVLFGLLTMAVEAKDIPPLERMRPFFFSWFRFLTVPGGKGCFYIFYGSLSLSLWRSSFFLALVGIYTASMGIVCVLVHFGMRQELQQHGIAISDGPEQEVGLGRAIEPENITPPAFS